MIPPAGTNDEGSRAVPTKALCVPKGSLQERRLIQCLARMVRYALAAEGVRLSAETDTAGDDTEEADCRAEEHA